MAAVKADFNFAEDLKKLREKTYNWTMAQDAALAKALEGFAAKFEDKLRVADESMAEFGLNLSRAEVRLANAAKNLQRQVKIAKASNAVRSATQRLDKAQKPIKPSV